MPDFGCRFVRAGRLRHGLLTVHSIATFKQDPDRKRLAARGVFGGILLLVLFGLNPQSDVIAHVGGFLGGVGIGLLMLLVPASLQQSPLYNRLAEWFAIGIMLLTWWLALSSF